MRLINVETEQFEWHVNAEDVEYAILSHTWGPEEVSFQDYVTNDFRTANGTFKKGYHKIRNTLKRAKTDKISFIWIDTCCIDKTSSAELSEAINSMYRWYKRSHVCYSYLEDVVFSKNAEQEGSQFRNSKWFTRGWTLQELIAPRNIRFFSSNWTCLGSRDSLVAACSKASGIPEYLLLNPGTTGSYSIAQRMSWASKRKTTRAEDVAYSLLGLFNVNMPTLYGEGRHKAFQRLQEELIKTYDDDSIFAFKEHDWRFVGFASSPASFADSGNIIVVDSVWAEEPHTVTNRGIRMQLRILPDACPECSDWERAALRCRREGDFDSVLGFYLTTGSTKGARARMSATLTFIPIGEVLQRDAQMVLILKNSDDSDKSDESTSALFPPCRLTFGSLSQLGYQVKVPIDIISQGLSSLEKSTFQMRRRRLETDFATEPGLVFLFYLPDGSHAFGVALIHPRDRDAEITAFLKPPHARLEDWMDPIVNNKDWWWRQFHELMGGEKQLQIEDFRHRRGNTLERVVVTANLHNTEFIAEGAHHLDIAAEVLSSSRFVIPDWAL